MRTAGFRNIPADGPALLVANHQSFLDTVAIGLAARRRLNYLARNTLFRNKAFCWLIESLGAVPINQHGFAREGLTVTLDQLRAGHAVIVFPEGNRAPDGKIQEFKPGVHLLIKKMDMPVIPVGIAGAFEAWPRSQLLPAPAPLFWPVSKGCVAVSIGSPLPSRELRELTRDEQMARLEHAVKHEMDRAEEMRRQKRPSRS